MRCGSIVRACILYRSLPVTTAALNVIRYVEDFAQNVSFTTGLYLPVTMFLPSLVTVMTIFLPVLAVGLLVISA